MPISKGLMTSLNEIRQTSIDNNTLYAKQVNEITPDTDIGSFSAPLFNNPDLMNEFLNVLVKKIIYTQLVNYKLFTNKWKNYEFFKLTLFFRVNF